MKVFEDKEIGGCDEFTETYLKSYEALRPYVIGEEKSKTNDVFFQIDYSSIGIYLCKCIEQEINSSIVQLMRKAIGIKMPDFYLSVDRQFKGKTCVDAGNGKVHHFIWLNNYVDRDNQDTLKTIPIGDAIQALQIMTKQNPEFFADYPITQDITFKEICRDISYQRNVIAHSGSIVGKDTHHKCLQDCLRFLRRYMKDISTIKAELSGKQFCRNDMIKLFSDDQGHVSERRTECRMDSEPFRFSLDDDFLSPLPNLNIPVVATAKDYEQWQEIYKAGDLKERLEFEKHYYWTDVEFEKNGLKGLKDILGRIVVPALYDHLPDIQSIICPEDSVVIVEKDHKYGLVEKYTCKEVTELIYKSLSRIPFTNYYFFQVKGQMAEGIIDSSGNEIVPCIIDKHYEVEMNCQVFRSGDQMGLLYLPTGLYIPPVYDEIRCISYEEPLVFVINGVEGWIDLDGNFFTLDEIEALKDDDNFTPANYLTVLTD